MIMFWAWGLLVVWTILVFIAGMWLGSTMR